VRTCTGASTWVSVATALVIACGAADAPDPTAPKSASSSDTGETAEAGAATGGGSDGATLEKLAPPSADGAEAFAGCTTDADCVAVPKVGCCHIGWKVAVAKGSVEAYASSYRCPIAQPICIQVLVIDQRVPRCDPARLLCELVGP
jgi:hypothetical protein